MSVYKCHAFIFLDQPPPWPSRTVVLYKKKPRWKISWHCPFKIAWEGAVCTTAKEFATAFRRWFDWCRSVFRLGAFFIKLPKFELDSTLSICWKQCDELTNTVFTTIFVELSGISCHWHVVRYHMWQSPWMNVMKRAASFLWQKPLMFGYVICGLGL